MYGEYLVIDADRHLMEPLDLWERYVEPRFLERARASGVFPSWFFGDASKANIAEAMGFTEHAAYRETFADAIAANFDAAANLRDMDREGVDVAVHFPGTGSYLLSCAELDDPPLQAALCRAFNNWLADYCSAAPDRLKGIALVPLLDTELAVAELRRAVRELGMVGVFFRPNPIKGRRLDHPDYFPVYAATQELGVPVCVHEGATTSLPQAGSDRYSRFGRHVACHPLEHMLSSLTLCADGVLERFPALKVAHLESGCGWAPYWLERMDEHWAHYYFGEPRRTTKEPPSFYFKRQCLISCEAGEELVATFVAHVGDAPLVLATDYPHPDAVGKFPDRSIGDLANNPALSAETKRKVLWDNPARLYGIDRPPAAVGGQRAAGVTSP